MLRAGDDQSPEQSDALGQLCASYWYPLYAFVRRQGASPDDAQDLTQEFFTRLLQRNYLDRADREKGKFRWFLLGAFKHFLSHQREHARAAKRGGGQATVSLDEMAAAKRYQLEPQTNLTPEKLYERTWALSLLAQVKDQLRAHYIQAGKESRFDQLKSFLPGGHQPRLPSEVAAQLGISDGTLRVELHRLRSTYRSLLRKEIAQTVSTPTEVDEELRHLIDVMRD